MSGGVAPDPLDRIAARAQRVGRWGAVPVGSFSDLRLGTKDRVLIGLANDVLALVEVARAARSVHEAFMQSGDCRTYPLVPLYAALDRLESQ